MRAKVGQKEEIDISKENVCCLKETNRLTRKHQLPSVLHNYPQRLLKRFPKYIVLHFQDYPEIITQNVKKEVSVLENHVLSCILVRISQFKK